MCVKAIGIPPWSDPIMNQGVYYSSIFGIVMLIISGNLTIKHFRKRYKNYVGRTVVISKVSGHSLKFSPKKLL